MIELGPTNLAKETGFELDTGQFRVCHHVQRKEPFTENFYTESTRALPPREEYNKGNACLLHTCTPVLSLALSLAVCMIRLLDIYKLPF